ncbi:family 20 glycosylhydrolase [Agromyces sp. S2-1-8]|uniref:family 20 glycosylhydrolase n=1 Tax=Agromyces sp. S2-1-8 TaxID=2897180 RepID=UPI001E36A5C6|nr:family 20 glycosylhydrolase [Agromyces sp. S2-1-8]MCD5348223.1 family 20 glycosylhydrolase [Agromyces sp. S2-1-8]
MSNDARLRDRRRRPPALRRGIAALIALVVTVSGLVFAAGPASAAASRDVAREGTATARSTYTLSGSFEPARMNDGDSTTRWGSRYTRTSPSDTYDVTGEWAQIELAEPTYILKVVLDWEAAYSTDYEIQVSNDGATWTSLRRVTTPTGQAAGGHLVQEEVVDTSDAWSFVRVVSQATATKYGLSLYSFQVWNQPSDTPPGAARDLARDGRATAKSFYDDRFVAANAIDGDSTTRWGSKYTRTAPIYDNTADWIQVELAEASRIHTVVLNWEAAYGKKYLLQVSNDGTSWTTVHDGAATGAGAQSIVVDTAEAWKFVRMQGVETAGIYGYSLFAFEVWGAQKPAPELPPTGDITPQPVSRADAEGAPYEITEDSRIVSPAAFSEAAGLLADTLRASTGFELPIVEAGAADGDIVLVQGDPASGAEQQYQKAEAYRLVSAPTGVQITASELRGAWNGTRTLLQLLPVWALGDDSDVVQAWSVAATEIVDYPRFAQRGLMIDPARNFLTVDAVKALVDQMSLVKMNRLHIHLTDDQGWRIQIDSWPNLTAHGASSSMAGGQSGFYTKDDFRDIVAYASARQIDVVPEIDVPGHSDAALSSYPVLDCQERIIPIRTTGGISTNSLCVGKPEVTRFISDVIREVAELTPGEYIHVGADEVEGITTTQYGEFIRMVEQVAADNGKKIIGWTPMPQAGTSKDAVHQYWADRKNHLAKGWFEGRPVILSPVNHAYMDYKFPGAPLGFREPIYSTKYQYAWDPTAVIDATTRKNLNASFGLTEADVQGVEAAAWGETFRRGGEDLEYMAWPRTLGIADKGWATQFDSSSFETFAQRAGSHGARLQLLGGNFWADPEIPWQTAVVGREVPQVESGEVAGVVARIASPSVPLAQLQATITWPDGAVTDGVISGADAAGADAATVFDVTGTHVLGADTGASATVTVTGPEGLSQTVPFRVDVYEPPVAVGALQLSDDEVRAGKKVTITATELPVGAQIALTLRGNGSEVEIDRLVADGNGTAMVKWRVPKSVEPGAYDVVLTSGLGSEGRIPLTVVEK